MVKNNGAVFMKSTMLGAVLFAVFSSFADGYITSVVLPDGTTKTFQDEEARQEIQEILSQNYLKPESVKAGANVSVTTNAAGEVTIAADGGDEVDFTTNNTVLVTTIETVAPAPGNYAAVSNAAMNALSRAEAGLSEWSIAPNPQAPWYIQYEAANGLHTGGWYLVIDDQQVGFYEGGEDTILALFTGYTATRTRLPTMADLEAKANRAGPNHEGNLAALDADGNPTDSGIAKTNVASKSDATLTPIYSDMPTFSEWTYTDPQGNDITSDINEGNQGLHYYPNSDPPGWYLLYNTVGYVGDFPQDVTLITWEDPGTYTATRVRTDIIGYTLGNQTTKPLASADPLLFAQYYPDGSVKSTAEFTPGIKYDEPDEDNRTITVKPFCNTGVPDNDNSNLSGRVVIPPFVDKQGTGYISDDGTKFKVVGVSSYDGTTLVNTNLTAIVAPTTVMNIGDGTFSDCDALTTVSIPAATGIGDAAFAYCDALTTVSLPAATGIGDGAFHTCTNLVSVSFPAATNIGGVAFFDCTNLVSVSLPAAMHIRDGAFFSCSSLSSVDFGDAPREEVPSLGGSAFDGIPETCKIIVPYTQYDEWKVASDWVAWRLDFVRHPEKADKPATFTAGNLAKFDANGNPIDSGIKSASLTNKYDFATNADVYKAVKDIVEALGGSVTNFPAIP